MVKLLDIGEIITGTTPSTKIKEYWGTGYPFVTPSDFTTDKYVNKTEREVTKTGAEKARLIPKNSVMVTCIASVGEVAMASEECVTNQQINTIICKETINPHFIYYSMLFEKGRLKRWAGSTTSPIIKKSLFEKFLLSLPSLTEQQKIAEILGTVDEAIQRVDEVIEKTKRLKQGLMKELLTKGIGHKEFKDSEIGRIPKEWRVIKLDDLSLNLIGGGTPSTSNPAFWDGTIPWMTSAYINRRLVTKGQRNITEEGLKNSATNLIPKENLLITTRVGIGKVAINVIDMAISQDLTGIIVDKTKSTPDFLYWFFISIENKLKGLAQGSTIKGILREELGRLKVTLPSLSEQQKIAEILTTVDLKIEIEEKRRERLERIKKGLMEELLTGKKRVSVG